MGDQPEELAKKLRDLMEVAPRVPGSTTTQSNIFDKSDDDAWIDRLRKRRAADARLKGLEVSSKANRARMLATNNSSRFAPPRASEYDPSVSGPSARRERYPEGRFRDSSPPQHQQREVQQYPGSSAPHERYSERRSRERNPPQHQPKGVQQYPGSSAPHERYSERRSRERSPPQYQQRDVQQYRQRDDHSREGSRHRNTSPFYQSKTQRPIHEVGAPRDAQKFPAAEEWARRQSLIVKNPTKDRWISQSRTHPPYHKKVHLTKQRQAEFETRGLECLDHSKRFKLTAVCGSCGHKHHYLCDCPIPDESGFVSGCPLCNTTAHDWDDCKRSGVLTWVQQYEIMFFRRINMPPIRSRKPWIMWEKERIDQELWSWDLQGVYPWTLAFVRELKQSERPWVNFDHKLWKKERAELPKDPATHLYSAEQLIDYAPLLEERSASSEDNIRNSRNTLQSGFNAAVHNTQTSQDGASAS